MPTRVLLADDDPELRQVIAEYLTRKQCDVRQAANGIDALRELGRAPPDVLIIDLMMPRLGGVAALRLVAPSYPNMRLIVITGSDDALLFAAARAAGAHDILLKPVDLPALAALVHAAPSAPAAAPAPPVRTGAAMGAAAVLVVDDDRELAAAVSEFLRGNGYRTRIAHSATEAFWAVMEELPDAMLLDISMPGLSGVEIIPALRFAGRHVKIIMVSGVSDMGLAKQALAYGAFDFVPKPVDFKQLLETVRLAVESGQAAG